MNIIKFRVWDIREKCFIGGEDGNFEFIFIKNELHPRSGLIFQQFTGLLDDNKKEIYEGDILRCYAMEGWFDDKGTYFNFEVKHSIIKSGESDISGFIRVPESRVVIGNVFETPELFNQPVDNRLQTLKVNP